MKVEPYIFDKRSKLDDTQFEVYFTLPDDKREKEYNYGFCINGTTITEEWLNIKSKTAKEFKRVFYRGKTEEELDLSGLTKNEQNMIIQSLGQSVLIASLGAKLKIKKCMLVRYWFALNETADFGDVISNLILSRVLPDNFADDILIQKEVVKYLSSFDDSITGFRIEDVPKKTEEDDEHVEVYAKHKNSESDLPLENESAGTLKMFALYQILCDVLKKGGVLFVDELNAKLHPLLVRSIILLFLDPKINKNHAQLLFTIHDAWQISDKTLRRDEIWFVEKNKNGESSLYSLADFIDEESKKIRKDNNNLKNYLLGKYGAIPEIRPIDLRMEGIQNEE